MPYIPEVRRKELRGASAPVTAGELNYIFTEAVVAYVKVKGLSYQTINDIKGALIGAKDEFGRRIADPYEDQKIIQNGDVYTPTLDLLRAGWR